MTRYAADDDMTQSPLKPPATSCCELGDLDINDMGFYNCIIFEFIQNVTLGVGDKESGKLVLTLLTLSQSQDLQ